MTEPSEGSSSLSWNVVSGVVGVIGLFIVVLVPGDITNTTRILIGVGLGVGLAVLLVAGWLYRYLTEVRANQKQTLKNQEQIIRELPSLGYDFDKNEGTMVKGTIRNVALRVQSAHHLVDNIAKWVPQNQQKEALYQAGKAMGETFSYNLEETARRDGIASTQTDKLFEYWEDYDATTGMGRFDFRRFDPRSGEGHITLKNGFLSQHTSETLTDYIIAGYLAGGLKRFVEPTELYVKPREELRNVHTSATFDVSPQPFDVSPNEPRVGVVNSGSVFGG